MMNMILSTKHKFQYALLGGITFSNEVNISNQSLIPFFKIGKEDAFLWKAEDSPSLNYLIIRIDSSITNEDLWKTMSSIFEFSMANRYLFEIGSDCDYHWIKNFDQKLTTKQVEFINYPETDGEEFDFLSSRFSGPVQEPSFVRDNAPFIELLCRDEMFYVMWMNLYSAFKNHYFCLICAYEKEGYRMHPNHEIPIWQRTQAIPAMEIGIVQSTRAVEAVLGKPGKKEVKRKFDRVLDRWRNALDIDPNRTFSLGEKSYVDYYYDLFNIRGNAAHSLGSIPYELRRNLSIKAQSFAFEIMRSYFRKNKISEIESCERINLNNEFI